MATVFISHSSDDRDFVEREIVSLLEQNGIRTWYSTDEIRAATDWEASIRHALNSCAWFLVALSPASVKSNWVKAEVLWALEQRRGRIVPLVIADCDSAECNLQLRLLQHIDLRQNPDAARRRLLATFRQTPPEANSHGEDDLVAKLRTLREQPDMAEIALVFRSLAHQGEGVRTLARQVIHALGWEKVAGSILDLARRQAPSVIHDILTGLAAIEASPDVIAVLVRLSTILTGDLRNRTVLLTERKRLSVEMATLAELFRAHHAPFDVLNLLGQGLFTATYRARHREGGLDVVVRVLRPEFAVQDAVRTQFADLSKRAIRYVHQNLVMTRDIGEFAERGIYYGVRDYIDGITLQNALDSGKTFEPIQIIEIIRQIVLALTPIHRRGEVHGGIKPSNIFITGDHDVLLGDLSLPVSLAPPSLGRLSYDYQYAAPEAFEDANSAGPASDLYSLGCVAHQLLLGKPPFVSDKPYTLANMHCHGAVQPPGTQGKLLGPSGGEFILRLLARVPTDRPRKVDEILETLKTFRRSLQPSSEGTHGTVTILGAQSRVEVNPAYSVVALNDPANTPGVIGRQSPLLPQPPVLSPQPAAAVNGTAVRVAKRHGDGTRAGYSTVVAEGAVIKRKYRIVREVGRGGMGTVYEVVHEALGSRFALKQLRLDLSAHAEIASRFRHEAQIMARLQHPHIVRVFDIDADDSFGPYILMEFISGCDLGKVIRERSRLDYPAVIRISSEVASALETAHRAGLVHRDIKPANILIEDGSNRAVVTDFGIAKQVETDSDGSATREGSFLGTYRYSSPEQIRNDKTVRLDGRADIYSLGAVMYEMYSGNRFLGALSEIEIASLVGFQAGWKPPLEFPEPAPTDFQALVEQCLQRDRDARPATAADVLVRLKQCSAATKS